ncbi:COP9 signalosome complex subunit 4 [Pseudomassariella vexata]|uniref:COP9 signalosome complex subunit 4 n=1 Tax=Pseudomassariella vexata TaxID=1141098 RepID=A0A1Y2DTK8_9PEZI|nr:COP9 signalosome complex subunit 4 [Pseudomassariella vexata]ORY62484.1 COP9 signalosome complex subunit 4 [Pseudomassariella vexata]
MSGPKVTEALAQVQSASDQATGFEDLLANLKSLSAPQTVAADLKAILDAVFNSALGIVAIRQIITTFIAVLKDFGNADLWIDVGQYTLAVLAAQQSTFLDQGTTIQELIADAHENNEDNLEAAKVLAEIPLDSSQRKVTNEEKVKIWVRIVRNYLEVDDTTTAETYLNKLKNVIYTVSDPALNLHFKLSQARIQDAKRAFLASSQAYHDISFSPAISEEERLHTLSMAIKCAILAPAGPLRSRALGRLFKDERAAGLEEFSMLEKMFFDRLLAPAEVEKFAQGLSPHQLATTSDGSTVLAKAVVEHNLLGASRLYSNIGFEALGALLGLDAEKAEDTTAKMIEQGRLVGRIDQIEQIVWFEGGEASGEKGSGRAEVLVGKEMRRWDVNVQGLAEEVENISNALQREYPAFVATNLGGMSKLTAGHYELDRR